MTVHSTWMSTHSRKIALPEPSGIGFEDCLRAALSLGGLYVQAGLKEVDTGMSDLFEVDILAQDFESGRSVAIEARSGKVESSALWKLAGIVHYLDTDAGLLASVKGAPGDIAGMVEGNDRLQILNIGAAELHNSSPWKLLNGLWQAMEHLGFHDDNAHRVDPEVVDTALEQLAAFLPQTGSIAHLGRSVQVRKLVPAQLRGVGVQHRLSLPGMHDLFDHADSSVGAQLCERWLRSGHTLLEADRNPAGVTSSYRCCPAT